MVLAECPITAAIRLDGQYDMAKLNINNMSDKLQITIEPSVSSPCLLLGKAATKTNQ